MQKNRGKCVRCGAIATEAHHIFPQAKLPELRLLIENGAPMCEPCHTKIPTYRSRDYYLENRFRRRLRKLCILAGIKELEKPKRITSNTYLKREKEKGLPFGLFVLYFFTDIGKGQKWRKKIAEKIKAQQYG